MVGSVGLPPTSGAWQSPILPRYRRPFGVGTVLDDALRVFQQAWLRFIGLSFLAGAIGVLVLALVGGVLVLVGGLAFFSTLSRLTRPGAVPTSAQIVAIVTTAGVAGIVAIVLGGLLACTWTAGICLITDRVLHGERVGVWPAFRAGFRRAPAIFGAGLLLAIGLALAGALSFGLGFAVAYVLKGWTALVVLLWIVALIVWGTRRDARTAWLKWFIILAAPFGLPLYFFYLWSLFPQAAALERDGPLRALQRSSAVVTGEWFRVVAISVVLSIIVYFLEAIPGVILGVIIVGATGAAVSTPQGLGTVLNVMQVSGTYIGGIIFGALPICANTIVFVSLRNQREGTDLAERLDALDLGPYELAPAAGAAAGAAEEAAPPQAP
jgi:hypothetical protein